MRRVLPFTIAPVLILCLAGVVRAQGIEICSRQKVKDTLTSGCARPSIEM